MWSNLTVCDLVKINRAAGVSRIIGLIAVVSAALLASPGNVEQPKIWSDQKPKVFFDEVANVWCDLTQIRISNTKPFT
jgi:hypothetical protein